MPFPASGRAAADVLADLDSLGAADVDFRAGRAFGLVYHATAELEEVLAAAHHRYVWHNALNPDALPSLRTMTRDVVAATASLFGGDDLDEPPVGFLTSGGTESILLAVKAAKVRGLEERGVERPNVVLATSAHAAFDKACLEFGLESRRIPVAADFRADPDAMADACDDATVLVVASAPQYPQGVVDPVAAIADVAASRDVNCHVDACMGGLVLPFAVHLGLLDVAWDFRVPGVTTISADIHKYGYTPKGVSVLLHRTKESRRRQTFVFDGWLGGLYASPGLLGTKPGGPIAAAWASFQHLGFDGFCDLTARAFAAHRRLVAGVRATPGLSVVGDPDVTLAAIAGDGLDVFAVGDELRRRGWHLDRQAPPESLHATVSAVHDGPPMDDFLADVRAAAELVRGTSVDDRSTRYAALD